MLLGFFKAKVKKASKSKKEVDEAMQQLLFFWGFISFFQRVIANLAFPEAGLVQMM